MKLKFKKALQTENLARIEVGLIIQIYQRLIISVIIIIVHSTLLSMDVRLPVHTSLINS